MTGRVTLLGTPPEMHDIPNSSCHPGGPPVREETVVADSGGHLANVVVYVKDAPAIDVPAPTEPVVLNQENCRYVPHVVAVQTGQPLRVTSSDPTLHNVYGACKVNAPFNVGMVGTDQPHTFTFARPEAFKVRCDVHPWMGAHVHVFDHTFFAVTRDAGRFEISRLPPGTYTLVAWHERFGTREQKVTIPADGGPGKPLTVDFTFGSAGPT